MEERAQEREKKGKKRGRGGKKRGRKGVIFDCLTVSGLRLSNPRRAQRGARWTWVNAW